MVGMADVVQVGKDVLERLQDENTQRQRDARKQERLSQIVGVFVVHREEDAVKKTQQHQR